MRRVVLRLGRLAFWAAWPLWFIYFKLNNRRSRILVVSDNKLLLLHDYLGGSNWGLPGGGAKRGEAIEDAAVRELEEEVGIRIQAADLKPLGDYMHSEAGLNFRAHFFLLRLPERPALTRRRREIAEAEWFNLDALHSLDCNADTSYALRQYTRELTL